MPIDIEQFEAGPEEAVLANAPTDAERVLAFLKANAEQAFTAAEIRAETGIPGGSVERLLPRLEVRGLVRHRGDYWATGKSIDIMTALSAMGTARAVSEGLGSEDLTARGEQFDLELLDSRCTSPDGPREVYE